MSDALDLWLPYCSGEITSRFFDWIVDIIPRRLLCLFASILKLIWGGVFVVGIHWDLYVLVIEALVVAFWRVSVAPGKVKYLPAYFFQFWVYCLSFYHCGGDI